VVPVALRGAVDVVVLAPVPLRRAGRRIARRTRAAKRSLVPAATFVLIGALTLLLALIVLVVVRDRPRAAPARPREPLRAVLAGVWAVVTNARSWPPALAAAGMFATVVTLQGLWGVAWLTQVYRLGRVHASALMALLALGVAIGAVALIVGIYLIVQLALHAYAGRSLKNDPSMTDAAVKMRIGPVAQVAIDPNAPAIAAASPAPAQPAVASVNVPAAAAAAPAKTGGGAGAGKSTYDTVCHVCHGAGVAGAPKFGDKAAWAPRIKQGLDALHASALKGKGAMPPKGGNPSLSDTDVMAAVDYMANAAK
jgi:cytochrome c5